MPRNFGFTKTPPQPNPPRPDPAQGRMAQVWEHHNTRLHRTDRRDRAYRGLAVALVVVIAGMLIAMIAMGAWGRAQIDAGRAETIMRF